MSDPRTDEELLAAVTGEPEAFGVFYGRHVRPLLGHLVRRTGNAELAADLCAETFAAALDGVHRFDPRRGPAVAWLYGVARVTLHARSETVTADVHENAYEIPAPVVAGEHVRLELERLQECRPSSELLDAVPALRGGASQTLPAPVEEAMPSAGVRQWARRIETGDELELWAVARCDTADRACVVGVHGGRWLAQPCATARDLRSHGTWWTFPVAGGLGVTGMAPPGTRGVQVVSRGRVHDLAFTGGVFGGPLPPGFGRSVDPGEDDASMHLRVRYLR